MKKFAPPDQQHTYNSDSTVKHITSPPQIETSLVDAEEYYSTNKKAIFPAENFNIRPHEISKDENISMTHDSIKLIENIPSEYLTNEDNQVSLISN